MGWEKGGTIDIRWLGEVSLLNNKSHMGRKEVRQADLRKNSVWGERKTSTQAGGRNSQEARVAAVEGRAKGQGWGEVRGATVPDQARAGGMQKDVGLYSKKGRIILTVGLTGRVPGPLC